MTDYRSILDRAGSNAPSPDLPLERILLRRDRRRRNQRVAAAIVGIAVFVAAVWIVASRIPADRALTPVTSGPTGPAEPTATVPMVSPPVTTAPYYTPDVTSDVDHVIDLNTGEMTPLPEAIVGALGETARPRFALGRYAASSDGSMLAFVGTGEEGTPQIFIAGIDGTGVRQVTHDPRQAVSPAWSPDGTLIAYLGYDDGGTPNVFVLDVATGETTQITHDEGDGVWDPTFTPDGRAIVYDAGSGEVPKMRIVPVEGGEGTLLVGPGEGIDDAGNGAISPDGSLVTFLGSGNPESGEVSHCGPCRFVANVDGTGRRVIDGWMATPAGMWSPDGTRIVTMEIPLAYEAYENPPPTSPVFIIVTDVASEEATIVANGRAAIWLDDHTLLVAV